MRICDVNSLYSGTGGGIRIYHDRKLEYFSGHPRHSAALIIPGKNDSLSFRGRARVYSIRSMPLFSSGYRMIVDSGGLNSAFLDYRPDIIEIGSPYLLPALAGSAMGASRVPTVGFYHSDFPDSYIGPYARMVFPEAVSERLRRMAVRHAGRTYSRMTAVFAASVCMLEKLYEAGVRRLFHTPLGVDTDRFSPAAFSNLFRREVGASGGRMLVLYLARLHWEKGLDTLMSAYPLFRQPSRIKLVIGGRGPQEGLVNEFIRKYPEVCRLPYTKNREAVAEATASADVMLSLGRYETFGLSSLEAISSGTIPVLSDAGASRELALSLGLLSPFDPDSPESLASSISDALRICGGDTTAYLRQFAVDRYDWNVALGRIEGFYERILAAGSDLESLVPPDKWWSRP
jgi:alpha-1,6-mannosyltransferase